VVVDELLERAIDVPLLLAPGEAEDALDLLPPPQRVEGPEVSSARRSFP
jgi:hypothetical protein